METIVLVVTIATMISGGVSSGVSQVTNSYSIPSFQVVAACEKAKTIEVDRMQKIATQWVRGAKVTGECVAYPVK